MHITVSIAYIFYSQQQLTFI